ncbi:MAG: hypothetical protein ACK4GN_17105 [Runella sp.]
MILQAGPLRILYENGFLRQIKLQHLEVLRMIYFALRDHNWGTFAHTIKNEVIEIQKDSFFVKYDGYNLSAKGEAIFHWKAQIVGKNTGQIIFEIEGEALQALRRNRAGFCVLHPIEGVAQQPVWIEHSDGNQTTSIFPKYIAAQDPFLDIRSMLWQSPDGSKYQLDFEGEIFQTEDQRNWGDASYKTFCTPLKLPFPVQLQPGDEVWQRIIFTPFFANSSPVSTHYLPENPTNHLIEWGIAESVETSLLSDEVLKMLQTLPFKHYRIDIYPEQFEWISEFSQQALCSYTLGWPLQIVLHLGKDWEKQLEQFSTIILQYRLNFKYLLLVSTQSLTTPQAIIDYVPTLKKQLPSILIGVGTDYNFTELNRHRFEAKAADFVFFSYHPQEHAFDDLTILENTETLRYQVESAEYIYQKPIVISLITLTKRANPYATNPSDVILPLDKQIDKRLKTEFGREWITKMIAELSQTSVKAVTLLRAVGELGIISLEGRPYPLYQSLEKGLRNELNQN